MDRASIRARLALLDRNQLWLAREIGMDPSLLSRILRARRRAAPGVMRRIEDTLEHAEQKSPTPGQCVGAMGQPHENEPDAVGSCQGLSAPGSRKDEE